jgi:hypothetical protein
MKKEFSMYPFRKGSSHGKLVAIISRILDKTLKRISIVSQKIAKLTVCKLTD